MSVWRYIVDLFSNVRLDFNEWLVGYNLPSSLVVFLDALIGVTLVIAVAFTLTLAFIWMERRFIARFQLRPGPNRCGPYGLIQPVADAVKILLKELISPEKGQTLIHWVAPAIVLFSALMLFAVIPIGAGASDGIAVAGALADLDIGILYIVAIGSVGVVGIFMAGWASNNKYSLIGCMRAVAQLVSYEVPMVISVVGIILIVGSLKMGDIVGEQSIPFILLQPMGFLIYFLGSVAELNRAPFDQIEAESELTTGYFTEYSGMKFGTFFLAEYINAMAVSAIVTTLFLSGWKGPFLPVWLWFVIKVFAVFMLILWMRATLIRVRIDQTMAFSWKFLLPMALINVFVTAAEVLIWHTWMPGWSSFPWPFIFVNFAVAAVLIIGWAKLFFNVGGGRVDVREVRARYSQRIGADI
ncbi:MAG: NADH-quinone oxidoreductase subunit NuoH [Chloroflexota bacterium]|nr:NADH-quinone oxidoreductase subunit NuoH [Chloroflexota bacterium]